jgi:hypothetical protein
MTRPAHRRRIARVARVLNTAQLDKAAAAAAAKAAAPTGTSGGGAELDDKSKLKAVHAKITAARELARRLSEEKQAVVAAGKSEDGALLVKSTELAAAAAAAQAARADAAARKLTRGEGAAGGREQLTRLRAENDALKVGARGRMRACLHVHAHGVRMRVDAPRCQAVATIRPSPNAFAFVPPWGARSRTLSKCLLGLGGSISAVLPPARGSRRAASPGRAGSAAGDGGRPPRGAGAPVRPAAAHYIPRRRRRCGGRGPGYGPRARRRA